MCVNDLCIESCDIEGTLSFGSVVLTHSFPNPVFHFETRRRSTTMTGNLAVETLVSTQLCKAPIEWVV